MVGFPLVNEAHVQWASRFPSQWLLPGAVKQLVGSRHLDPAQRAAIEEVARYQTEAVMEDLERWTPDLVVVSKQDRVDIFGHYLANATTSAMWRPGREASCEPSVSGVAPVDPFLAILSMGP
jgi:hypothetical protein